MTDANDPCLEPTPGDKNRHRYRLNGRAKMLTLDTYPTITLPKARQMRNEGLQMLIDDLDPGKQNKATKHVQKAEWLTLETLAREWLAYNPPRWAESTTYKAKLFLENDLIPGIGSRALKSIT